MTPDQVFACLAGQADSGRRRMPLADGLAWCRKRREHKQRWIRRMMEGKPHGQ